MRRGRLEEACLRADGLIGEAEVGWSDAIVRLQPAHWPPSGQAYADPNGFGVVRCAAAGVRWRRPHSAAAPAPAQTTPPMASRRAGAGSAGGRSGSAGRAG